MGPWGCCNDCQLRRGAVLCGALVGLTTSYNPLQPIPTYTHLRYRLKVVADVRGVPYNVLQVRGPREPTK